MKINEKAMVVFLKSFISKLFNDYHAKILLFYECNIGKTKNITWNISFTLSKNHIFGLFLGAKITFSGYFSMGKSHFWQNWLTFSTGDNLSPVHFLHPSITSIRILGTTTHWCHPYHTPDFWGNHSDWERIDNLWYVPPVGWCSHRNPFFCCHPYSYK